MDVDLPADLRAQTHAEHRALEDRLKLPQHIVSRQERCAVLAAWLPPEHDPATADGWAEVGLDPHLGEAATLLRDDLSALEHASSPAISGSVDAPPFDTTARAAGGRYVLLGSAIGGRVLAPAIERRLGSGAAAAARFFRRDGLDPAQDWHTFQSAMTSRSWSRHEAEQATGSARATFEFSPP